MKRTLTLLAGAALLFSAACASPPPAEHEIPPVNDTCPIMPAPASPDYTAYHGDTKIGFCCPACLNTFESASDADKAEVASSLTAE